MIVNIKVKLKELSKQGKSYCWSSMDCPRCNRRMWGHGYVSRYFEGFIEALWLKRFMCASCGCVVTVRPVEYWRRYQTAINSIFDILLYRVRHFKWPPVITRQRAGHWLSRLLRKAKACLLMKDSLIETVEFFQQKNLAIF